MPKDMRMSVDRGRAEVIGSSRSDAFDQPRHWL